MSRYDQQILTKKSSVKKTKKQKWVVLKFVNISVKWVLN